MLCVVLFSLFSLTVKAGDIPDRPYEECVNNQHHQSPIALEANDNNRVPFGTCGGELDLSKYDRNVDLIAENHGSSIYYKAPNQTIEIRGADLIGPYKLDKFHFHWGSIDGRGSEHTIQGKRYALECHFVHTGNDNVGGDRTLAVVGILFKVGKHNPALERLLSIVDEIHLPEINHPILTDFNLKDLLPLGMQYYQYLGSLTTPPCTETVEWFVMHEIKEVSHEQLEKFRSLLDEYQHHIQDNYRDLQDLGDRHPKCCGCDTIEIITVSAAQNVRITSFWHLICLSAIIVVIRNFGG